MPSDIEEQFNTAAELVRELKSKPTDSELLSLYGLYKQGTEGDCNTQKPLFIDLKGCAKWDSWNKLKGTKKEDAQKKYIKFVVKLSETYGLKK